MNILGIHDGHNGTAALMVDGQIVAAISEERLTRRKNEMGFPVQAVKACLRLGGMEPGQLDTVAFSTQNFGNLNWLKIKREFAFTVRDWLDEQELYWKPLLLDGDSRAEQAYYTRLLADERFQESQAYDLDDLPLVQTPDESKALLERVRQDCLARAFGISPEKVVAYDHHTCHQHYAYFGSPFRDERCLVLTNDGGGDGANGTVAVAENNVIREISRNNHTDLGRLYRYITLLLGMKIGEHEFKVMGLAPYASDYELAKCRAVFDRLFKIEDGMVTYDQRPTDLFFHFRDRLAACRFDGIAAAVQEMVENVGSAWVQDNVIRHQTDRVVFSGGVSMNVKLNKKIAELRYVNAFYCPASGGDESIALGACYVAHANLAGSKTAAPIRNNYLGNSHSRDAVLAALGEAELDGDAFCVREGVADAEVAGLLAEGLVIGRLAGPMEFGARSLGNRSILADPSKRDTVERINRQIKFRDFWMPFAPSVLASRADDYLINPKGNASDHMTLSFDTTAKGRVDLIAAVHPADRTVRAHIVQEHINPKYHALIRAFESLTGIGALLNTSFNLHGEPVVCHPLDAIHTLVESDLDAVLMEDVLVMRKRESLSQDSRSEMMPSARLILAS